MSDPEIHERLEEVKRAIGWGETTMGAARRSWEAFEDENRHQLGVVLRLAEELAVRKATISEFFIEYVYSNITTSKPTSSTSTTPGSRRRSGGCGRISAGNPPTTRPGGGGDPGRMPPVAISPPSSS